MTQDLGCFSSRTCEDISESPGDPGLSAALCDAEDFITLCACCRHTPAPACAQWPPNCGNAPPAPPRPPPPAPPRPPPPAPPSPAPPGTPIVTPDREGCQALSDMRGPGQDLKCTADLEQRAVDLLRAMLLDTDACTAQNLLNQTGLERAGMAVLAGAGVLKCTWNDAIGAWLDGRAPDAPVQAGATWSNVPDGIHPGALLFSAGAINGGCAQGNLRRDEGDTCAARLCVLDPPRTTPSLVTPSRIPVCSDACRGKPPCA